MKIKHFLMSWDLLTCSYKSSNILLGNLSCATWGSTASHLPLLMSAVNVSRLSTVLRETWHSFWRVWKDWCKEFSLQNWRTILITLQEKEKWITTFISLGSWISNYNLQQHGSTVHRNNVFQKGHRTNKRQWSSHNRTN